MMATTRFYPNPRFAQDADKSPPMKRAVAQIAREIADNAEMIVPTKYGYTAEVVVRGTEVSVEATTTQTAPGPLAGWLEFGGETGRGTIPALHPLQNGARKAKLKVVDRAKRST